MITLTDFWMGRDREFAHVLGTDVRANAARTVDLTNELLALARADGVTLEVSPRTRSVITSGWRPGAVNAATPGAAVRSKHITGQAVDLFDPDGDLDAWCLDQAELGGLGHLARLGLWLEHPAATKGWCHLQTVPPRSGRRVFYP